MSNHLAIATVTGTLRRLLSEAAAAVPGAVVTTKRPDGNGGAVQGAAINIFLYQVATNAAYRNEDLPTRRSDGQLVQRPRAAVVLHYLLSFYGDEERLEPQRLLGAAIRQIHARPALTAQDIRTTITNPPYNEDALLAKSNLHEQLDLVRFTPLGLSLDEVSKVWSVFFQTPYVLSTAYQAGPILIETEDSPRSALPVKTPTVEVVPFREPFIEEIAAETTGAEIFATSTLLIRGKRLKSPGTFVLLDGAELPPVTLTDTRITLSVPVGMRAGAHGLQIVHKLELGPEGQKTLHRGFESNIGTFVLRPRITNVEPVIGPALKVDVDVLIGKDQRVVLTLDSTSSANPRSYTFVPPARAAAASSVTIGIPQVAAGTYFVSLQVDGAASPLDLDSASPQFGPTVTLP